MVTPDSFRRRVVAGAASLSTLLLIACAGLDPAEYNIKYTNADPATVEWSDAVDYAQNQRDKYSAAARSLERMTFIGGMTAVGVGGAAAGAGAAEVSGSVVTALSAGLASLLGVGQIVKSGERAKIFRAGETAIQCSLDVVSIVHGSPTGKSLALARDFGDIVKEMEDVEKEMKDYAMVLERVPIPGAVETLEAEGEPKPTQQVVGAVKFASLAQEVAEETGEDAHQLIAAGRNRQRAKANAAVRLVKAVNAIRGKVADALQGLLPSIQDIKKAANVAVSPTNNKDKQAAKDAKQTSAKNKTKLQSLEIAPSLISPKTISDDDVISDQILRLESISARDDDPDLRSLGEPFTGLKSEKKEVMSPKDAIMKVEEAADNVERDTEKELLACLTGLPDVR